MRDTYSELDHYMMEYEILLEQTGLPYCDYKVYDSKKSGIRPIEKFQRGIHKLLKILRAQENKL